MPNCPKCGTDIPENTKFCIRCGEQLLKTASPAYHEKELSIPFSIREDEVIEVNGTRRTFPFFGMTLVVSPELDAFNTYRLRFREYVFQCLGKINQEYVKYINDLDSFADNFPDLYYYCMEPLVRICINTLVKNGIWTVTEESFTQRHSAIYKCAVNDYEMLNDAAYNAIEAKSDKRATVMSYVPQVSGVGFGLSGILKSMATTMAINMARDGLESRLVNYAKLSATEKYNLYHQLNPLLLLDHIYYDYFNIVLTLVDTLNDYGQNIWRFPAEDSLKANNIFENLSNPLFPREKIPGALLEFISNNPYKVEFYQFAVSRYGETTEIKNIMNYFGYTDLSNNWLQ